MIIIVFIHHIKVETIFTRGGISLPLLRWVLDLAKVYLYVRAASYVLRANARMCTYKCTGTSVNTRETFLRLFCFWFSRALDLDVDAEKSDCVARC